MALYKPMISEAGVPLTYHRIAMLSVEVNQQCTVLVHGYVAATNRQYEKDWAAGEIEGEPTFPYVDARYLHPPYDEGMCLAKAYEWLKGLPEYEGAEDA